MLADPPRPTQRHALPVLPAARVMAMLNCHFVFPYGGSRGPLIRQNPRPWCHEAVTSAICDGRLPGRCLVLEGTRRQGTGGSATGGDSESMAESAAYCVPA